jgi:hypothetical protein
MRRLAGTEPLELTQGPAHDAHAIAAAQLSFGQNDNAVTLARTDFIDDAIGHGRRVRAIHDQPNDTNAPTRIPPTILDGDKAIAGKQRRQGHDMSATAEAPLTNTRNVTLKSAKLEKVLGDRLALRLDPGTGPETHLATCDEIPVLRAAARIRRAL